MSTPCTVIIGAADALEALRENAAEGGDVLTFSDSEPLKAVEAITSRRPGVIALERLFAATSRGAALINRIKADPALAHTEIRIVSLDGTYRVSRRRPASKGVGEPKIVVEVVAEPPQADDSVPARNLDYRGTRRAPRFRMAEGTEVQVDGTTAALVDLSIVGAQIVCAAHLRPKQQVRMILGDDLGLAKFNATIAWVSFEIPKGVSRYRAGVAFNDAEPTAVDAFCKRHKS
jgi:hypothetical protein